MQRPTQLPIDSLEWCEEMKYLFYKVDKNDIYMIKFLLEGYDNMASVTTIDQDMPKIQITVAPDFETEVLEIVDDLKSRFYIERLTGEDESKSQGNY